MPILNVENIASTTEITENGLHDVAQYTTADVNVSPSITSLNVTPTTSAQTITAPAGTDGYSPVNVSAVTSSIDANITAGNIKDGVTILGVTGNYQGGGGAQTPGLIITGTVENGELQDLTMVKTVGITDISGSYTFNEGCVFLYPDLHDPFEADLSSLTTISGEAACHSMLSGTPVASIDLSSLTEVSGEYACDEMAAGCESLETVDLSSLTTISGSDACAGMFINCSSLTSIDLSSLTTMSGYRAGAEMFGGCSGLTSVDLSSLSDISGENACLMMFRECSIETISFPAITTQSFGEYTNQFEDMFSNCESLQEIHFPSNVQSVIEGLDGYGDNFGAYPPVTIYFDLPATE